MASIIESKVTVVVVSVLLLYFLWMDIALFYHVNNQSLQRMAATSEPNNLHQRSHETTTPISVPQLISPFTGLSVKMMMMDPVNNYIFTPAAQIFNELSGFSTSFTFITPNAVSFVGILFAIAAARCLCWEARLCHGVAICLFQMRTFCDALDGIVARARIGMVQHVSLRNTSGYVVDGVADAIGFAAFLVGCFQYLRALIPKTSNSKHYLPLSTSDACCKEKITVNGGSPPASPQLLTPGVSVYQHQRRVFFVVLCFGVQMAIGAFFWDHYINAYHNLLETQAPTSHQTDAQNEVLRSSITWILMWFWRLSNAHTFIQFLLFAIYLNKLWEFLTWIQYIGFAQILVLAFFTEIHLTTVRGYIMGYS